MLQRTRGSALLLMLVVTGFASQVVHPTLSNKERRTLTHYLKTSKTLLLQQVAPMSQKQMNYTSQQFHLSIHQLLQQQVALEEALWTQAEENMKNAEKGFENIFTDEAILNDTTFYLSSIKPAYQQSIENSIDQLKKHRRQMILFANTTTGNVRMHFINTPAGTLDIYQTGLLLCRQTESLSKKIEAIKKEKGFPKY